MQFTIADRKKHTLEPGTPEWLAHRAQQFNAGDAAAALGCSEHASRTDLLDELVQGFGQDVSYFQEKVYANGHRVEALARPIAEQIMGAELYPLVYSAQVLDANGQPLLSRRIGASVDGRELGKPKFHWECKSLNDALRAALPYNQLADIAANDARKLPKMYRVQMCQQALVLGSEAVLFTAAQFDAQGRPVDVRHAWYEPEPALCAEIIRGWIQLDADLPGHTPIVHAERARGEKVEAIGLPVVRVMGSVVESNLPQWKALAIRRIEAINKSLTRDEHFGQAKEDIKWAEDGEKALKKLKADVIGQMASVEEVVSTLDDIAGALKRCRLDLEDLVKVREREIRVEACQKYQQQAEAHRTKMVERIRALGLLVAQPAAVVPGLGDEGIAADFMGAIKGLRTIKSLHDKAGAECTRVKLALSAITDRIELNVRHLQEVAADWMHLFADRELVGLVRKEEADFQAIVGNRIAEAQRAEQQRREREEAEAAAAVPPPAQRGDQPPVGRTDREPPAMAFDYSRAARQADPDPFSAPAGVTDVQPKAPRGKPTLKLGTINEALGFTVTRAFLEELGFTGEPGDRNAILFHVQDWPAICAALSRHCLAAGQRPITTPATTA